MIKSRFGLLGVFLVLAALLVASPLFGGGQKEGAAGEEKKMVLKFGHTCADTHPYSDGARKLAELVAEKTGGKLEIQHFPAGQLGGERDITEGLQAGTVDMMVNSLGVAATFVPEINLFNLPFIFTGATHYDKVVQGPVGEKILAACEENELIGLGFTAPVFRIPMNNLRPINTPADFQGMKIRLMEVPLHMDTYKALGATPVPIAFGELYTALQLGTVDGCENAIATLFTQRFYEVQKYMTILPVVSNGAVYLMSKKSWDKLPESYQEAIMSSMPEAIKACDESYLQLEEDGLNDMVDKGLKVNTPPDIDPFVKAVAPIYDKYLAKMPDWVGGLVPEIRTLAE